jgi:hypothetical protein
MAPEEVTHAPFLPGDYIIVIGGKGHDFRKKITRRRREGE